MKIAISFLIILSILTFSAKGQQEESPTVHFLKKRGYAFQHAYIDTVNGGVQKWPDTLYYNTVYHPRLMGSPTIPISFSKIEVVNGQYEVSPTISIGYGYEWFWGDFIFN